MGLCRTNATYIIVFRVESRSFEKNYLQLKSCVKARTTNAFKLLMVQFGDVTGIKIWLLRACFASGNTLRLPSVTPDSHYRVHTGLPNWKRQILFCYQIKNKRNFSVFGWVILYEHRSVVCIRQGLHQRVATFSTAANIKIYAMAIQKTSKKLFTANACLLGWLG